MRAAAKERQQAAKARRAVEAITHLVDHSIVPADDFYPTDRLTGLEAIRRWLFDSADAEAAVWWQAVGIQSALLADRTEPETFDTSRPFVAVLLDMRIESERRAAAGVCPFEDLAG
jgi:hypothetical protein